MPSPGQVVATLETRFWSKVDKRGPADCWLWTGGQAKYGIIWVDGVTRYRGAHRISYQMANGDIPDGMLVCHKCDNPLCVNPEHLFLGTPGDNVRDMISKKRNVTTPGEKNAMAKLNWSRVREIRAKGGNHLALSKEYGVSRRTISDVLANRKWRETAHVG